LLQGAVKSYQGSQSLWCTETFVYQLNRQSGNQ
jgi:hypothetical protein